MKIGVRDALPDNTDLVFECMFELNDTLLYDFTWIADTRQLKKEQLLTTENIADHFLHQNDIPELDITVR